MLYYKCMASNKTTLVVLATPPNGMRQAVEFTCPVAANNIARIMARQGWKVEVI